MSSSQGNPNPGPIIAGGGESGTATSLGGLVAGEAQALPGQAASVAQGAVHAGETWVATKASDVAIATIQTIAGGIWNAFYAVLLKLQQQLMANGRIAALAFAVVFTMILFAP